MRTFKITKCHNITPPRPTCPFQYITAKSLDLHASINSLQNLSAIKETIMEPNMDR